MAGQAKPVSAGHKYQIYLASILINCIAKKTRQEEQTKRDANDRDISEYFTKGAGRTQAKPKVDHALALGLLMSSTNAF